MKYWVSNLSEEQQQEIKNMIKSVYLNMCKGDIGSFQEIHDMSMDEAIENGMGSKIYDIEELIEAYFTEDISLEYQLANKEIISQMWEEITGKNMLLIQKELVEEQEDIEDGISEKEELILSTYL